MSFQLWTKKYHNTSSFAHEGTCKDRHKPQNNFCQNQTGKSTYATRWFNNCLRIDDITSASKFGGDTWLSLHFIARSVFCTSAFYRQFCKIANLSDIVLDFLGLIPEINIDYPAKFYKTGFRCVLHSVKCDIFGIYLSLGVL